MLGNQIFKKILIPAPLISPSKIILFEKQYQAFDTVFQHQMKHLEIRRKYFAARVVFNSLLGVSSGDETLRLTLDSLSNFITLQEHFMYGVKALSNDFSTESRIDPKQQYPRVIAPLHLTVVDFIIFAKVASPRERAIYQRVKRLE